MSNVAPLLDSSMKAAEQEPFQLGDPLTVVHLNGTEKFVTFAGVFGLKLNEVEVRWGMAGVYKVDLKTGKLLPKKASRWRVCDKDMRRIEATIEAEKRTIRQSAHEQRYGK